MKESNQNNLHVVYDVPLEVSAILGHVELKVSDVLKLSQGSVIELDKKVGEPVDVKINGKVVARGEVVLVGDKIGVTLTEIVKND